MSASLWSFTWSRCLHPPPFSPQKRSKKRQWKNAAGREINALSLSLFGMLTELLLFCVSLGILGCFCPPSFSRESLWIAVFTWGLEKAVIGLPRCGEGCFLGQLASCLLHKDPGAAWSDWWGKSPCPQLLASVSALKLQVRPLTHASRTRSSPSVPYPPPHAPCNLLSLLGRLEEVTSQLNYFSYVRDPALCFGNDRTVWKMFIFALI